MKGIEIMRVKFKGIAHNLYIWFLRQVRKLNTEPDLPLNLFFAINYELLNFLSVKEYIKLTPAEFEKECQAKHLWLNHDPGFYFRYEYIIPVTQVDFYKNLDYYAITKLAGSVVQNSVRQRHLYDYFGRPKLYVQEIYFKSPGENYILGVLFHETKGYPPRSEERKVEVDLKDEVF